MKYGQLLLTKRDYDLINLILINWKHSKELMHQNYLALLAELKNVILKEESKLPTDVVKFGSKVHISTPFGPINNYELVVPSKRDVANKKLSVLSPIGSAILGYAEGDDIEWHFPVGKRNIKILRVENTIHIPG